MTEIGQIGCKNQYDPNKNAIDKPQPKPVSPLNCLRNTNSPSTEFEHLGNWISEDVNPDIKIRACIEILKNVEPFM